jgi:membrane fusion protein, heavy metal efflux system
MTNVSICEKAARVSRRSRQAALLGLVALVAGAAGCKKQEAAAQSAEAPPGEVWLTPGQMKDAKIEVKPIELHFVDDTILTSGTVSLDDLRTGHVFSPVTGRVIRITAGLGQHLKKGDPLAVIESPDIGNAVSDVHKAEADLVAAEHDLKRKKQLKEEQAGPQADVEAANDTYRRAKAELERARAKEQLLRLGNVDMVTQSYTLPSPVDGEVLNRQINPGVEVVGQYSGGATVELFTIGELDRVWVLGDLYEMDFARVKVGTPATVSVVAFPGKVFNGAVDWVAGSLDPNTRTAKVRCSFDNPEHLLRPNMYATVQISVDRENTLAIPRNAVLRVGDDRIVFLETGEDSGHVRFKRVTVDVDEGESNPFLVVRKGLDLGQKLVVNGGILLAQNL